VASGRDTTPQVRAAAWLVAFLAALSTSEVEPFTSNQETYLVRAVARAREGAILNRDWFVRTRDPVPLFTRIAEPVVAAGPWAMWLVNAALGAAFLVALTQIACGAARRSPAREPGSVLGWVSLFGLIWVAVPGLLRSLVFDGLAGQRAFSEYLQPSNAGVLLVAAAWLALNRRSISAVLLGATSAWIHPTYALSSVLFTAGVCWADWRFGERRQSVASRGLAGLVAIAPPALVSMREFAPTSAAIAFRAGQVLVAERLPHHALIASWGNAEAVLRLAPIVVALAVIRGRQQALFIAWTALTLAATALVSVANRPQLLLLFPWRATVWLIPAAAALLLGHTIAILLKDRAKWILVCLGPLLAACSYRFVRGESHHGPDGDQGVALARKIQPSERRRWSLLVPVDWEAVRLNAPAAIYVDFKSHPYQDAEVLAWWDRVSLARAVYSPGDKGCGALSRLLEAEPRLGFVLAPASADLARCAPLSRADSDRDGILYCVRGRTSAE